MSAQTTLRIRQNAAGSGKHLVRLALRRADQPELEAEATIEFALTPQEQEDLRWYMEDYLMRADSVEDVQVEQIEQWMKRRGEELYTKVLAANMGTQAIWFAVREQLADLRVEITSGIAEAASIPWELMRDPQSDSAIALRVQSFVRVQSDPNLGFVPVPPADEDVSGCSTSCAGRAAETTSSCGRWSTGCCRTLAKTSPASTSPPCDRPPSSNSGRN